MSAVQDSMLARFCETATATPNRPAVWDRGEEMTYRDLASLAVAIAQQIPRNAPRIIPLYAERSAASYAAVIGIWLTGRASAPIGPVGRDLVAQGHATMLGQEHDVFCVDSAGLDAVAHWPERIRPTACVRIDGEPSAAGFPATAASPDDLAYVMSTSGSTGIPKGVAVSHRAVRSCIDAMQERMPISAADRLSQVFPQTFDVSIYESLAAWSVGACICLLPLTDLISLIGRAEEANLTTWFSTPSVAGVLRDLRAAEPDQWQGLRRVSFIGEALPVALAKTWARAAPNAEIQNVYGPTECTVACSSNRWTAESDPSSGIVSIGTPFQRTQFRVADAQGKIAQPGTTGELWIAGDQLADGYWMNPDATTRAFVESDDGDGPWFRTGDLAVQDETGEYHYLGRADRQVQVRGVRLELQAVEVIARQLASAADAAAIAHPLEFGRADHVDVWVQAEGADTKKVLRGLREHFQSSIRRVHVIPNLPRTPSGKTDYLALAASL